MKFCDTQTKSIDYTEKGPVMDIFLYNLFVFVFCFINGHLYIIIKMYRIYEPMTIDVVPFFCKRENFYDFLFAFL